MSNLILCILGKCGQGQKLVYLILDVLGPIFLEIIIISIAFEYIVTRHERNKQKISKASYLLNLFKQIDEILFRIIPNDFRSVESVQLFFGNIKHTNHYRYHTEDFMSELCIIQSCQKILDGRPGIFTELQMFKQNIINIMQTNSKYMDSEFFGKISKLCLEIDNLNKSISVDIGNVEELKETTTTFLTTIMAAMNSIISDNLVKKYG